MTGGSGTSEAELEATWRSICGLEPERLRVASAQLLNLLGNLA